MDLIEAAVRKFVQQPLAVAPEHIESALRGIREQDNALHQLVGTDRMESDFWTTPIARWYRPYRVRDGVLTIPVRGTLTNQHSYQVGSYQTGYRYVEEAVRRGVNDLNVRSIIMDINSPGGTAAGAFPASEEINSLSRATPKRVIAYTDQWMMSGAYALGSAAQEIVVGSDADVGSVGVVRMHADVSKLLGDIGIDISFIHAGKHKVDGNPFQPLPDDVRARFQDEVDETYGRFVSLVANNRGIGQDAVRATEALVYGAGNAVDVGFANRIVERRSIFAELTSASGGAMSMTQKNTEQTADKGKDAPGSAPDGAGANAASDAVKAERARTTAVLGSDEYKGREPLAAKLLESDMSAEQIIETMKSVPLASGKRNHFQEHMDKNGGTGVEATDTAEDERIEQEYGAPAKSVRILQSFQAATGHRFRDTPAYKGAAA